MFKNLKIYYDFETTQISDQINPYMKNMELPQLLEDSNTLTMSMEELQAVEVFPYVVQLRLNCAEWESGGRHLKINFLQKYLKK